MNGEITGYLAGCAGPCGRMFMLDQPTRRTAPAGWIGPPDLTHEPFVCAGCVALLPPVERCDCGCTIRPGVCSCDIFAGRVVATPATEGT